MNNNASHLPVGNGAGAGTLSGLLIILRQMLGPKVKAVSKGRRTFHASSTTLVNHSSPGSTLWKLCFLLQLFQIPQTNHSLLDLRCIYALHAFHLVFLQVDIQENTVLSALVRRDARCLQRFCINQFWVFFCFFSNCASFSWSFICKRPIAFY